MAGRTAYYLVFFAILSNSKVLAAAESWEAGFTNSLVAGLTP